MKYTLKQIVLFILIIVVITSIILFFIKQRNNTKQVKINESQIQSYCYYRENKLENGFKDVAWLRLNIDGLKVSGEFQNLPTEKDSKKGAFEGTLSTPIDKWENKILDVSWDSFAEGMENKEELMIKFGDENTASVGFGEMKELENGSYGYKDKENIMYQKGMSKVDCTTMTEKLDVEKYVRENINKIAPNNTVLGGIWYAYKIETDQENKTGYVEYEDGHVKSEGKFTYEYDQNRNIKIIDFKITE